MAPPLLPMSGSGGLSTYALADDVGGRRGMPVMLRRLTKFKSMLTYLVVAPRRVYKQTYHHKQTKNMWARDDPAMLYLISGCLAVVYHRSLAGTAALVLRMIFRDFILFSILVALVLWFVANRLLLAPAAPHAAPADNRVELTYAFDVAVNAFFPAFLTAGVALLPLAAVVVRDNWVCLWVGNTLFLVAATQYIYVTYLGYAALPFVARSQVVLAALLPTFGGYLLSLLGFNVARHALELYFGQSWRV